MAEEAAATVGVQADVADDTILTGGNDAAGTDSAAGAADGPGPLMLVQKVVKSRSTPMPTLLCLKV